MDKKPVLETYSFLVNLFSFVVLPVIFIIRVIQGKDVSSWKIKSGNYVLPKNYDKNKKTVMIHGVSVGEIVSLEKLIRKVKEKFPLMNLVVSAGTKTGYETAVKKLTDVADFITFFPLDTKNAVINFLNAVRPDFVLIDETEIWPVFAYNCYLKKIPVFIINGRISDESYKSYKILKPFFKNVLSLYKGVFVQSELDKTRLLNLGTPYNSLEVMKNLKFDVEKFDVNLDINSGGSKILIAGSTHKGEDEIILRVYKKLKQTHKTLKLILAPRHITRKDAVEALVKDSGFSYSLYSNKKGFNNADILLVDVLGELAKLYAKSDIAFIGGSFNKTGGHNPLEAVIFNKPAISGPSIKNFRDIYSILTNAGAGFVVKKEEEFFNITDKLLSDEDFYKNTSAICRTVFQDQQGALEFVINKLKEQGAK